MGHMAARPHEPGEAEPRCPRERFLRLGVGLGMGHNPLAEGSEISLWVPLFLVCWLLKGRKVLGAREGDTQGSGDRCVFSSGGPLSGCWGRTDPLLFPYF